MGGRTSLGGTLSSCFGDSEESKGGCDWSTLGGTGGAGDSIALSGGSGRVLSKSILSLKAGMGEGWSDSVRPAISSIDTGMALSDSLDLSRQNAVMLVESNVFVICEDARPSNLSSRSTVSCARNGGAEDEDGNAWEGGVVPPGLER